MCCQAAKCRFPETHTTRYHKCGQCKAYGHGRVECSQLNNNSYSLINELYNKKVLPIDKNNYCTFPTCPIPSTHSKEAHQKDFDKYADEDGPDYYGIKRQKDEGTKKVIELVKNKNGFYAQEYWGMGIGIFARNNNGVIEIERIDYGNENNFIKNYTEIKK